MHNTNGLNPGGMALSSAADKATPSRGEGPYVAPRPRFKIKRDECGRDLRNQRVKDSLT